MCVETGEGHTLTLSPFFCQMQKNPNYSKEKGDFYPCPH